MFGYVNADKPNMLIKDYAEYRAYYCGLCKCIGKRTKSQLMRFGINYDVTMLALLAHNYNKLTPQIKDGRCVAHILGRKFPIVQKNDLLMRIADINTILGYYKMYDDVADGGSLKHKLGKLYLTCYYRSAARRLPDFAKAIKACYDKLRVLEREKVSDLDRLADCSAVMLQEVGRCACGRTDGELDDLCYNLGRWVYFIDAYDDLEKDVKDGKFNPFVAGAEYSEEQKEKIHAKAEFLLNMSVAAIRDAYDRMDITVSEGPLSNIIYRGLRARTEKILSLRGKQCKKTLL